MSNEPKINLRQISSRIDIEDFARIRQAVRDSGDKDCNIALHVRRTLHNAYACIELDDESKEWICQAIERSRNARAAKPKKRRNFLVRIFSRGK